MQDLVTELTHYRELQGMAKTHLQQLGHCQRKDNQRQAAYHGREFQYFGGQLDKKHHAILCTYQVYANQLLPNEDN